MMPVASCIPFLFFVLCDDMLTMLVYAICWLYMHLYTLSYMSMHKYFLLVCCLCFNTMKLWTSNPNLHLSLADTTFCFLSCMFAWLSSCFLICLCILLVLSLATSYACHVYHAYLLYAFFICTSHLSLPLLVCRFLVFAFACTHMEQRRLELGHNLPDASKKGTDTSMWLSIVAMFSRFWSLAFPFGYVLF